MKYITVFINLFLISTITIQAQEKVGYYHDLEGNVLHDYYEQLIYQPKLKIKVKHYAASFEPGVIYRNSTEKKKGLVKLVDNKLWYKESPKSKPEQQKVDKYFGFTIGVDSFFVATHIKGPKGFRFTKRDSIHFMHFIEQVGDYQYAKFIDFFPEPEGPYSKKQTFNDHYYVRTSENPEWIPFPRIRKGFKTMARQYFGVVPGIGQAIFDDQFEYNDLGLIIKNASYNRYFITGEEIYFDKHLNEIKHPEEATYIAKIKDYGDSTFTIDFKKNNVLAYSIEYLKTKENRKHGKCLTYYPNGPIRSDEAYENGLLKRQKRYSKSGQLISEMHVITIEDFRYGTVRKNQYLILTGEQGQIQLNSGEFKRSFEDEISKRTIYQTFKNQQITESYYLENGEKIHHMINPPNDLKLSKLEKELTAFLVEQKVSQEEIGNSNGNLLVAVKVNKGRFEGSYKILNELSSSLSEKLDVFLQEKLATSKFRFPVYKVGKKKVKYEILIPINVRVDRFNRQPKPNYIYHDLQFQEF